MGGKAATSTSTVQVPPSVLARYDSVNATAEKAAATPFQQYSTDPSAFVAPLSATQQSGIQNTNNATSQAQPYYQGATGDLLNAQGAATPFYGQAAGALGAGASQANSLLGASNSAVRSGLGAAQPLNNAAVNYAQAGTGQVNASDLNGQSIGKYLSPYLGTVLGSTEALVNQQNQQAQAGQLGNAITSGGFGGDRAGIAAANLAQQQELAGANAYSNIANQGYNTALGTAQQQQGVNLGAQQANRAALQQGSSQLANIGQQEFGQNLGAGQQLASNAGNAFNIGSGTASGLGAIGQGVYGLGANTATSLAGLGAGAQSAALQGATAQLTAGQQEQSTQQAGLTSLYNQFLQQQAYPFQTSQFLANIAEGTGSLSGSTTSTTQPTGLFGNLLSDRRAKEDIKHVGQAKNGLKIYTFRYKGDPEKVTHLGFMADEVEKKHPEAVGLAGGLKTVNYDRAARADGGGLVFDPNAGEYGLGAASMPGHGTYVPAPQQSPARRIMFQATPPAQSQKGGLGELTSDYKALKGAYNDVSEIGSAGKNMLTGLGAAAGYSDGGSPVDDPYNHDSNDDLRRREVGLRLGEGQIAQAPNSAANSPVAGALSAQDSAPRYQLNAPAAPGNKNSGSGDLQTLGTMAKMGSDAAPYIADALSMFALKSGGLVPREHHADGDSVGDDPGIVTPEDPRLWQSEKPAPGLAAAADVPVPTPRPKGLGAGEPVVSPDAVSRQPDLDASRLDAAPMPPSRPKDLGAPAPSPGLAPPPVRNRGSVPRAARTMIGGDDAPAAAPVAGLGGASPVPAQDVPSFLISRESGGKFNASNPASSAYGLGQITTDTAKTIASRHPNLPSLSDFYSQDPNVSVPAQKAYISAHAQDQAKVLAANGIDPTAQNIHMNWFLGEAGGPAFLKAMQQNPNAPGVSLARPEQVAANKSIFYNSDGTPKTASQVYAAINGGGPAVLAGPSGGASQPQQQQPGLVGSLSSFFGGHPDGQTSPNGGMGERALMAVLSGLGAVGSYKGQSVLGAALQGLGAGAHGWMESGKQQADIANQQAHTGLVGAETNLTNVSAGRGSILPEANMVIGPDGRVHYINKDIAGRGIDLYGAKPNASTTQADAGENPTTPAATTAAPKAPVAKPELTGIGYDNDSTSKARNEVLAGPQSRQDLEQSAAYQSATQAAGQAAQTDLGYSRRLATELVHAYGQGGVGTPGFGFSGRASAVSALNTAARSAHLGNNYFGDADKGKALSDKINTLQAAMREHNAGQHSLGALEAFKGANATLDQPPEASAEISSQLMADKMMAQDQWQHMEKWKSESPGSTVRGAAADFNAKNPSEKYISEADELKKLMLTKNVAPYFDKLSSGRYSYQSIANSLKQNGFDPNLARYFAGRPQ